MQQIDDAIKALKEIIAVKDDIKLKVCGLSENRLSSFMFGEMFSAIESCVNFLNLFNKRMS